MEAGQKKALVVTLGGVGLCVGLGVALYLLTREAEPPPPGEDYGRVQGYIIDEETGAKIANAEVLVDDEFDCYSDYHGLYRTSYMQFGTHMITVKANNYQTATFTITLEQSLLDADIALLPVPETPTEWTEGVEIISITVKPSLAYVGETVEIDVYIQYPHPLELPADIYGTILVNGQSITGQWTISFRNPTLRFQYTAASPGDFTVTALDKSANFKVQQAVSATYYSPFGGVRMPACIQVTIPNVEPFDIYQQKFEGGDYLVDGFSDLKVYNVPQLIEGLKNAYPSKWDPSDAVVNDWVTQYRTWYGTWFSPSGAALLVMATDYDCREWWDSKDELAKMIATGLGEMGLRIPDEWYQYGTTCPTCDGTGQIVCTEKIRIYRRCIVGEMIKCKVCDGSGKVFRIDLRRGLRDWVYPIKYTSLCGAGYCTPRLYCPYCDKGFDGPSHVRALPWDKISFVRMFLTHIEKTHPDHPLTAPAWF